MLQEKREKASSKGGGSAIGGSNPLASTDSSSNAKAKVPSTKKSQPLKEGPTGSSREATPTTMDMAERIKTEGRPRKAASAAPSEYDTPAPSPVPKVTSTTEPPKPHKPGQKKGTAAPTKKQQHKKSLTKSKINGMYFGLPRC